MTNAPGWSIAGWLSLKNNWCSILCKQGTNLIATTKNAKYAKDLKLGKLHKFN